MRWHLSNADFNISVSKCGFLWNDSDPNHLLLTCLLISGVWFVLLSHFLIIKLYNCFLSYPTSLVEKGFSTCICKTMTLGLFLPWFKIQYSPSSKSSIKGGPGMSFDVLTVIPLGLSLLGKQKTKKQKCNQPHQENWLQNKYRRSTWEKEGSKQIPQKVPSWNTFIAFLLICTVGQIYHTVFSLKR